MRQKALICLGLFAVLIVFGAGFAPVVPVAADPLLQDAPRLDNVTIYFTEGNGEASRFDRSVNGLSRFAGLVRQQGARLETLEWRGSFPADADLVIVAGPVTDYNADQVARLWTYMNQGGRVLFLVDPVGWDRTRPTGVTQQSGLFQLMWTDMGVRGRNDIVLTEGLPVLPAEPAPVLEEAAEVTEEAEEAAEGAEAVMVEQVPPPLPAPITHFVTTELADDHPTLQGIRELAFFRARSIEIDLSIREFPVEPLVFSDVEFYGENNIPRFYLEGTAVYNIGEDVPPGFLPLITAYENPNNGMRFVLVGDRDFATNGYGLSSSPPNTGSFIHPDNPRFLLNVITWLLDAEQIAVAFPTPAPTATVTLTPTPVVDDGLPRTTSDLGISISVSNERPVEGELILYEITVTNDGPDPAINITLNAELPNGLGFVLASGGSYTNATGVWTIDFLDSGSGATLRMLTAVRRGTVGTTLTNTFRIAGSDSRDPNPDNNAASIDVRVVAVVLEEGQ